MLSYFRGRKEEALMKKMLFSIVLFFGLTSCSFNDVLSLIITPTPALVDTATPDVTGTPEEIPTITPTQPTPTFTVTPTLLGAKAPPTANPSDDGIPTLTPLPTLTRAPKTNFLR